LILKKYKFIFGENQLYEIFVTKELRFIIDGEFSDFDSVYVNDLLLEQWNYTVSVENTNITLNNEYLDTLDKNTYTIKFVYKNGGFAQTDFVIEKNMINSNLVINYKNIIIILFVITYLFAIKNGNYKSEL